MRQLPSQRSPGRLAPTAAGRSLRLRTPLATIAAVALAAGLAGCGETVNTGKYSGEGRAVAERVSSFQKDVTAASQKKLCEKDLAGTLAAQIRKSGSTCEDALKEQLKDVEDVTLNIQSIAVHGGKATAEVQSMWSGKQRLSTLKLVKEGGTWRIDGLGPP